MKQIDVFVILMSLFLIFSVIAFYQYFYQTSALKTNAKENTVDPQAYPIPLKIFQTWHTKALPPKMRECVEKLKADNPEFEHYLFDDDDCRKFIHNHFDSSVVYAFDSLVPGAFKADLWRYCVLYIHGGVYLDIKYRCRQGCKLLPLMTEEHFVKDYGDEFRIYNAFIICKPQNKIIRKCIDKVVENVKIKYYGVNELDITGPTMMARFFNSRERQRTRELFHHTENYEKYIVHEDKIILESYPEYRQEQKIFQKNEAYPVLWKQRRVYV